MLVKQFSCFSLAMNKTGSNLHYEVCFKEKMKNFDGISSGNQRTKVCSKLKTLLHSVNLECINDQDEDDDDDELVRCRRKKIVIYKILTLIVVYYSSFRLKILNNLYQNKMQNIVLKAFLMRTRLNLCFS